MTENIGREYTTIGKPIPSSYNIAPFIDPIAAMSSFQPLVKDSDATTRQHSDQNKIGHSDPYQNAIMNSVCSIFPPVLYGTENSGSPNDLLKKRLNSDTDWEDAGGYCFKDNLDSQTETVCDALETHIDSERYILNDKAVKLAKKMIGFSKKWLISFFKYISDYNKKLTAFGFKEEKFRWEHVRELISAVISYLHDSRRVCFNSRDPAVVLWVNLRCIKKCDEFLKHGFESHPVVNSCLVRTIVKGHSSKNSGGGGGLLTLEKVDKMLQTQDNKLRAEFNKLRDSNGNLKQELERCKKMESRLKAVEAKVK